MKSKRKALLKRVGICPMCGSTIYSFRSSKNTCSDACRKAKERYLNAAKLQKPFVLKVNGKEVQW